jgi:DTW domain-containing protein YfiP
VSKELSPASERPAPCPNCLKITDLCVCSQIQPTPTRLHVLILQHPQEPDKNLGSARLAHLALPNSTLKIGLSWPNLAKALGRSADPQRWAVLYLGSGVTAGEKRARLAPGLTFVSKKSQVLDSQPHGSELEGIIVLDGTWSQAKTLWWRNAWLLKLKRAILTPREKSLYQELRKEPRRECLSTIESVAEALEGLGEPESTSKSLRAIFAALLEKQRSRLRSRAKRSLSGSSASAEDPSQP